MKKICCICGKVFDNYGNNPDGAVWYDKEGNLVQPEFKETDRCCDECNMNYVIPGRLYKLKNNQNSFC